MNKTTFHNTSDKRSVLPEKIALYDQKGIRLNSVLTEMFLAIIVIVTTKEI